MTDLPRSEARDAGSHEGRDIPDRQRMNMVLFFVKIILVISVCEGGIILLLRFLGLSGPWVALLDPILLAVLCAPLLYGLIVAPFRLRMGELDRAQAELLRRIEQLATTNAELERSNREIAEMAVALRSRHDEMAQQEKMVAIGTMAAGVAHEIGNPLACLSSVIQLLKRRDHSPEERSHLDNLEEQVDRIATIVRQLLAYARPDVGERLLVDVSELVEQTLEMIRYSHRSRRARIESVCRQELPEVRLMPQQFQQVLINLILNALDAVAGVDGDPRVQVEQTVEGGWVTVTIKDNGAGMTEKQLRMACEPFYTTKAPGKGTGLGLSVSYRLVAQQGGRIHIESTPGEGTVVRVSFQTEPRESAQICPSRGADTDAVS